MILLSRATPNFIEIRAEKSEITIWKEDQSEINEAIIELLIVIDRLASYTDKSLNDYVEEFVNS